MDQSLFLTQSDRKRAVEDLSRAVAGAVKAARAGEAPFHHVVFDRVFPEEVYAAMLAAMPLASDYRPMSGRSKDQDLTNGVPTRVKIDLFPEYIRRLPPQKRAVWDVVGRALCSHEVKQAFVQRLAPGLERRFGADFAKVGMYPIPILTRDIPGYKIPPHPDTRRRDIAHRHDLPRAFAGRQPAQAGADEILAQYRLRLCGRGGHLAFG
jgi:hypothetical protein